MPTDGDTAGAIDELTRIKVSPLSNAEGPLRYWNVTDGQVFALVVMVVAATEVVIGLGLVVAVFRQRLALDVDQMSTLKG